MREYIEYLPSEQKVTVDCEEGYFEADVHLEDDPIIEVKGDYLTPDDVVGESVQEKAEDLWRFNRELFNEIL